MQKDVFSSLIAKQSRYLKPHAMKYTRDEDDAKDLIQDTLLKALLNYEKFREDTNIRGWLFIIMRNLFVNGSEIPERPDENYFSGCGRSHSTTLLYYSRFALKHQPNLQCNRHPSPPTPKAITYAYRRLQIRGD